MDAECSKNVLRKMHHNKDYNILLKKLISGTITDKERWTLERASLDDPFLADAIEGIYDNDVDKSTRYTLSESTKVRRLSWYKPLAVAASVVLLLGFSFMIVQNTDNEKTGFVAEAESDETMGSGTLTGREEVNDNIVNEEIESTQKELIRDAEITVDKQQPILAKKKAEARTVDSQQDKAAYKPVTKKYKKRVNKDYDADQLSFSEEPEKLAEETSAPPRYVSRTKRKINAVDGVPPLSQKVIKGHVYDQGGFPISKALVSTETKSDSAFTNEEGYFAMALTDMNQKINIQSSGFADQSTLVKPDLSITLQKAQSTLGQEPMLLVETMNSKELEIEYSRLLDEEFREPFSICPQEQNTFKRVKLRIEISESGELLNVDYITDLSENCQNIIEDKIFMMSLEGGFKGKKAAIFYYNLRL